MNIRFDENTVYTKEWLDNNEEFTQRLLAKYKLQNTHPRCECTKNAPSLYIAKRNKYYLAKMPNTGKLHNPECESFDLDVKTRGLGVFDTNVVTVNSDGMLAIKLQSPFSHKKSIKIARLSNDLPPIPPVKHESSGKQDKMTLSGFLSVLWEEAELNRWYPLFAGKRSWAVLRRRLLEAAENILAKKTLLSEILFIPEPFKTDKADDIDTRRRRQYHSIMQVKKGVTQYMVVVGRIREVLYSEEGCSIRLGQQGNNVVYWGGKHILKKLINDAKTIEKVSKSNTESRVMTMMVVMTDDTGALSIRDIGFLEVDNHYLPLTNIKDGFIINALIEEDRAFIKTMDYSTHIIDVHPSFLLLDVGNKPYPMGVFGVMASEAVLIAREKAEARWRDEFDGVWIWDQSTNEGLPPALPEKKPKSN